jgi:adenine phosphoribosyltransferase
LRLAVDGIADRHRNDLPDSSSALSGTNNSNHVNRSSATAPTTDIDLVVGIEARGFIFGTAIAYQLGVGFVPLRKPGKLPGETIGRDFDLEYGKDRIELHVGAIKAGQKVLLVDDLIATGGTAEAAVELLREVNAELVECAFVIALPDLGGVERLEKLGCKVHSLCEYAGD